MTTYWFWRVRYTSLCLIDVPMKYRESVRSRLRESGLSDCGNAE